MIALMRFIAFLFVMVLVAPAFAHESVDPDHAAAHAIPAAFENARVDITTDARYRYIRSNGLPNHETGDFPNRGNPNSISAQNHNYRVPLNPQQTGRATPQRGVVGVALNGIPFEPGTAEFWQNDRNWNYEALSGKINLGLDRNNAHVQPTGTYHYHGIPTALVKESFSHVGYVADGFPIYVSRSGQYKPSYVLKRGNRSGGPGGAYDGTFTADYEYRPGFGHLDQCNGITIDGQYVYVLTDGFPHIPRCLMGAPDESFARGSSRDMSSDRGQNNAAERRRNRPPRDRRPPPPRF